MRGILKNLDEPDPNWSDIATSIQNLLLLHQDEYPDFLEYIDGKYLKIKKKSAESVGNTLKCPQCGNFNPESSKFCLICGNKFT